MTNSNLEHLSTNVGSKFEAMIGVSKVVFFCIFISTYGYIKNTEGVI